MSRRSKSVAGEGQGRLPATDASGEEDYGHIDALHWDNGIFELEGAWGQIRVVATGVGLNLEV
jgi:hypothetical protein